MPEQQAMIKEVLQSEEKGYQRRNQIFVKAVRILEIENIRLNIKIALPLNFYKREVTIIIIMIKGR